MTARLLMVAAILACGMAMHAQDESYLEATTQPAVGNVQQGETEHHCLSFAILRLSSISDDFIGLTVRNNGTATAADFTQVQLWWDANDSDTFEPAGPDVLVSSVSSGAFPRTFPAFPSQTILSPGVYNYFLSVDVAASATVGNTFILEVQTSDVTMQVYPVLLFATQPTGPTQTITPGAAGGSNQIAVTQQPAGAQPGTAFTMQPVVELQNSTGGLLTTDNTTIVTASITTGSGTAGAVLSSSTSLAAQASGGVVTFSGLSIDLVGANYTLTFTATNFADGTSTPFDVGTPPTPTQLVIATQPAGATPGSAFTTQPVVEIRDASNQLVTTATHFVSVTLNGGGGGTLSGTLILQAVNGVAAFPDLAINQAGTGYSLTFSAVNLTSATSTSFDVTSSGGGSSSSGGGGGGGGGGCAAGHYAPWPWLLAFALAILGVRAVRRRAC